MTRVCVVGAAGRMGRLIVAALADHPSARAVGAIVSSSSAAVSQPTGIAGLIHTADLAAGVSGADLVLDFSTPTVTPTVVETCARHNTPVLVGTTGHTPEALAALMRYGADVPLALVPNTSVGVLVLRRLARQAQEILGPDFDVAIFDLHHRHKRDAPSGTADLLATELAGRGAAVPVASLRGGDVPGEHTVLLLGPAERLELTHRVRDRGVFAAGALRLGLALVGRPAGVYRAEDLVA
jgi:4-hydroxy-tetrahydrodipicolinate reductase